MAILTGLSGITLIAVVSLAVTPSPASVTVSPSAPILRSQVAAVTSSDTTSPTGGRVVYVEVPWHAASAADPQTTRHTQVVGDVRIVWLGDDDPARTDRGDYELAMQSPGDADEVTVWMDHPVEVTFAEATALAPAPGTLITDADGALVAVSDETGRPHPVDVSANTDTSQLNGSGATTGTG